MTTIPIEVQVSAEGMFIPLKYLGNAERYEVEVQNGRLLVRPSAPSERSKPVDMDEIYRLHPWIGSVTGLEPDASEKVEAYLQADFAERAMQDTNSEGE